MKKLVGVLFGFMFAVTANAAQVVNVQYVHDAINRAWNISVPYNESLVNPSVVANMKYVLTAVDVANAMLNGAATSDWGNSQYATRQVADTVAVDTVVAGLIKVDAVVPDEPGEDVYDDDVTSPEYPFAIGLVDGTEEFTFLLSVRGDFVVDWGDGTVETISKPDVSEQVVSHRYDSPGDYKVRIGGVATGYDTTTYPSYWIPAISAITVSDYWSVEKLYGRLGRVFPTLADGTQPRFAGAFMYSEALTDIPATLFDGISGNLDDYMFYAMFESSYVLTEIPDGLFDGFSGEVGTGALSYMFANCDGLTGASAKSNGVYLYNKWANATAEQVGGMYMGDSGLSDYDAIPSVWK